MASTTNTGSHMAIVATGLGKTYERSGDPKAQWVFRNLDLSVEAGEMVCLSGPSGCGKTTLLTLLAGLERPSEGTVSLMGKPLTTLSELAAASLRRHAIGFVFQFFYLLPNLTALENIALPLVATGEGGQALVRAKELGTRLGLSHLLNRYPRQISGGEQQRVAFARAIITGPGIIMADEPTGNLDAASAGVVLSLLRQETVQGRAVVVASHNPRLVEISDRVVDLSGSSRGREA